MIRKEIREIRKQFGYDNALTRVAGCYVDADKNIISVFSRPFYELEDDDRLKHLEIFKKAMSGSKGKQLTDAEFPLKSEGKGSMHEELMGLLSDQLKSEEKLRDFFAAVIAQYPHSGNYAILATHDVYDVPGKAMDETSMDDASDTVFPFIMMAFCPVELAKPGLSYHGEEGMFLSADRSWIAGAPEYGFMFPEFNDRAADIHAMLVYDKKREKTDFTVSCFGCQSGIAAEKQSEVIESMIQDAFAGNVSVKNITDMVIEIADKEEAGDEADTVGCNEMLDILDACGADADDLKRSAQTFEDELGNGAQVDVANVVSTKSIDIEGNGFKIKADLSAAASIIEEERNGVKYLCIPVGSCTVNGIRTGKE